VEERIGAVGNWTMKSWHFRIRLDGEKFQGFGYPHSVFSHQFALLNFYVLKRSSGSIWTDIITATSSFRTQHW
jgi:hypothetical protein